MKVHKRVFVAAVIGFVLLVSGCLGGVDSGQGVESASTSNASPGGARNHSQTTEVHQSPEGFPQGPGVGDNASLRLERRYLQLTPVEMEDTSRRDGFAINVTRDASGLDGQRLRAHRAFQTVFHGSLDDRRIEPPSSDGIDTFVERYRMVRRYLADAMLRATPDGPVRQNVSLLIDGNRYRVTVGENWTGGPTLDPSDPPTDLTVRRDDFGADTTVTLWHNDTRILSQTTDVPSGTVLHTLEAPGRYRVRLETYNDTYEALFNVSFDEMADCNPTAVRLYRGESGGLIAKTVSTLQGCSDPADVT